MRDGSFTGVGLSRYINGANQDFYNARRIVNSTDKASYIAEIAQRYLSALGSAGSVGSVGNPDQRPATTGYRDYYVKSGEYPSAIAMTELGDASRWTEILKEDYTPLTDWDTTRLQVGQLLRLPFGYQSGSGKPATPMPGGINQQPQTPYFLLAVSLMPPMEIVMLYREA